MNAYSVFISTSMLEQAFQKQVLKSIGLEVPLHEVRVCPREGVDIYTPYFKDRHDDVDSTKLPEGFSFQNGFVNWRIPKSCFLEYMVHFLGAELPKNAFSESGDVKTFSEVYGEGVYEDQVYDNPLFCLQYAHVLTGLIQRELGTSNPAYISQEKMRKAVLSCMSAQKSSKKAEITAVSQLAKDFLIWYNAGQDMANFEYQTYTAVIRQKVKMVLSHIHVSAPNSFG